MFYDVQAKVGEGKKLETKYKNLYIVTKVLNRNKYVVRDIPGVKSTSQSYNTWILFTDKLKPWVNRIN